jgi:cell division septal protein FtsQ
MEILQKVVNLFCEERRKSERKLFPPECIIVYLFIYLFIYLFFIYLFIYLLIYNKLIRNVMEVIVFV